MAFGLAVAARPWTRPLARGLVPVIHDRIGSPSDMGCIGSADRLAIVFW